MQVVTDEHQWNTAAAEIQQSISELASDDFVNRLFKKDASLWKKDISRHADIVHRLGWLDAPVKMSNHLGTLESFAADIKSAGYAYAVLLGMGGSSLGPEVLQTIHGNKDGFPELLVLDSTDPRKVAAVEEKIKGKKTLFIVASKSGGTIESISLFRYFYANHPDAANAGEDFIAITDPETTLIALAEQKKFRKVFLNPPDVGGRYSVLTLFGLVPAAVIGMDVKALLESANQTRERLKNSAAGSDPGIQLGVAMAKFALSGRDKITITTPGDWDIFGDWAEQLIAESTGKEGKGIVPVVREELGTPEAYAKDRYFAAFLTPNADDAYRNKLQALSDAGHPVTLIPVEGASDLGREFYRWEIATAVSGVILNIDPFDQPNVQSAKTATGEVLNSLGQGVDPLPKADFERDAIAISSYGSEAGMAKTLQSLNKGDYVAILAFLPQVPEVTDALSKAADDIRRRTKAAVTVGIGPRYLHSTGQLHKGGDNNGVFIVLSSPANEADLEIPEAPYSFSQLQLAQSRGDYEALLAEKRRAIYLRLPEANASSIQKAFDLITVKLGSE